MAYGPYGGAGVAQRYNPRTGTYSRGAVAYGPYGARGAASAYNPRTGTSAATRQGSNVYGSWGTTGVAARRRLGRRRPAYTNNVTGNTTRVTRTSDGDVYAGRDGNVYRKEGDSFQKYGDGGWSNVDSATPEQRQQAQDRAAQAGAQTRDRATTSGMDSATRQPGDSRFRGARRGRAAHARLGPGAKQRRIVEVGQLPRERRRARAGGGGRRR